MIQKTAAIVVPDLGDGIVSVQVALWLKKEGERVAAEEDVVEVVTDKASFYVPSPSAGILKRIVVAAGEEAPIGAVLGELE
ncbi:MAG: hypothetical protein GX606_04105 [Elusimicrobia bacterium]|nr:hypothetical protein [Elusimicrobiota bacterium]